MRQIINIREINQNLSRYIRTLKPGQEIVITRRGKPVARLTPCNETNPLDQRQQEALQRLRKMRKHGFHLGGQGIDRDSLHER